MHTTKTTSPHSEELQHQKRNYIGCTLRVHRQMQDMETFLSNNKQS